MRPHHREPIEPGEARRQLRARWKVRLAWRHGQPCVPRRARSRRAGMDSARDPCATSRSRVHLRRRRPERTARNRARHAMYAPRTRRGWPSLAAPLGLPLGRRQGRIRARESTCAGLLPRCVRCTACAASFGATPFQHIRLRAALSGRRHQGVVADGVPHVESARFTPAGPESARSARGARAPAGAWTRRAGHAASACSAWCGRPGPP